MDSLHFMAFILLCFTYQKLSVASVSEMSNVIQLGMMESSAAYIFIQSDESDQIAIESIKHNRENNTFDDVWRNAEDKMNCTIPRGLRKEYMLAIYAYTAKYPVGNPFNKIFNDEVREYGATDEIYAKNFKFKSFQYLLTVALQKLKDESTKSAVLTYRGIRMEAEGAEGSEMRFGSFASTSFSKYVALHFINKTSESNTLFTIRTLYGANITQCSRFPGQKEVLIPPYEVFRVGKSSSRTYGMNIFLMGQRKHGVRMKLEKGKDGGVMVVPCKGNYISASRVLWILAVLTSITM
ncbi:erythroblast NAD(P)(+)--arginine ADP-ribosyltransferase-like [Scyliorhinus canicula]|uniref:erythroblast NAD(P)(+)--arginine ADP-ribosyltransferase-like n=1 Tax=Scyliorhinus canicula TaxID=7830 RepID=UPI0018F2F1D0|nr:erythroblast NAD(P)(+)--arginine ADP-ribosyltransferase-like [Scyliorhinus canicula]